MNARIIPFPAATRPRRQFHSVAPATADEPLTREQRTALNLAIGQIPAPFCHPESRKHEVWIHNRLRIRFQVARLDDILQSQLAEAFEELARIKVDVEVYWIFNQEIREFLFKEVIGAGLPWTPYLVRQWRAKMHARLPERPDWIKVALAAGVEFQD